MASRSSAVALLLCLLTSAPPAMASTLGHAAVHAQPQYYLITLPAGPADEIAQAVLGETLGLPFQVDPAVDADLSFRVEGLYSPRALARELGDRLWDADVALIETPADGLWLIPRSGVEEALSEGAELVSPGHAIAPKTSRPAPAPLPPGPGTGAAPEPARPIRSSGLEWIGLIALGWLLGVASLLGWSRWRKARLAPEPARLSGPAPASEPVVLTDDRDASDDLVIPRFTPPSNS